jgi:hypothetical protein
MQGDRNNRSQCDEASTAGSMWGSILPAESTFDVQLLRNGSYLPEWRTVTSNLLTEVPHMWVVCKPPQAELRPALDVRVTRP